MTLTGNSYVPAENLFLVPLCPPEFQNGLACARTHVCALKIVD